MAKGLILTRKLNESIMIGDDIEVSIAEISKGKVRISIQAPEETCVLRKEIYKAPQPAAKER